MLANLIGVPLGTVKQWEQDRNIMRYYNYVKIKRYFDIQQNEISYEATVEQDINVIYNPFNLQDISISFSSSIANLSKSLTWLSKKLLIL